MKSVIAAFNSSIQYNKHNFWIDTRERQPVFRRRPVSAVRASSRSRRCSTCRSPGINQSKHDRRVEVRAAPDIVPGWRATPTTGTRPRSCSGASSSCAAAVIPTEVDSRRHLADDRPERRRSRPRPRATSPMTSTTCIDGNFGRLHPQKSSQGGQDVGTRWDAYDPDPTASRLLEGTEIELSGEYAADDADVREPGNRPDPGRDHHLFHDGRPGQVVPRAALRHDRRAADAGRRLADALSDRNVDQRAVADRDHLQRRASRWPTRCS